MSGRLLSMAVLQAAIVVVALIRAKTLAVVLGPADFGIVSTIDQLVLTVSTLGALALPFTAMKFMARHHDEGAAAFQRSGSAFLRIIVVLGLGATIAGVLLTQFRPRMLGGSLAAYGTVIGIALLGVAPAMLLVFFVNALAAARRPAAATLFALVAAAAVCAAAVAGATLGGVRGVYVLTLLASLVVTAGGLLHLSRAFGIDAAARGTEALAMLRGEPRIAGYSLCFYATFAGGSLMMLLLRTTVLARSGEVAVGQLQALLSIALTVGAVLYPLSNLYLSPLTNGDARREDKAAITEIFASRMLILLLIGALPALLFPATLLKLLFSGQFVPVASALWLFVMWQCLFQIAHLYQQLLIGLDDIAFAAGAMLAGSAIVVALMVSSPAGMSLAGTGVALITGMAVWGFAVVLRLRWRHGIQVSQRVLIRLGAVLLAVATAGSVYSPADERTVAGLVWRLLGAVASAGLLLALLDARERDPRVWFALLRPQRVPSV